MKRTILFTLAILTAGCQSLKQAPQTYTWTVFAGQPGTPGSADGTNGKARFNGPWGVAVDRDGNVFVADLNNQANRVITPSGAVTTLVVNYSLLYAQARTGVAVDRAGNVFGSSFVESMIYKVTNGELTHLAERCCGAGYADGLASTARFGGPFGVAVDASGNLYVADTGNCVIRKLTTIGTNWVVTTWVGSAGKIGSADGTGNAARFCAPRGVAVDNVGNVYVADTDNQTIRKVSPSGVVTTFAGTAGHRGRADGTSGVARFSSPNSVAVDNVGNVYVADTGNQTIRKVSPNGLVNTIGGSKNFIVPYGIAVDSNGNLYVADYWQHCILKGTPSRR